MRSTKLGKVDLGNEAQRPGAIADICFGLPRALKTYWTMVIAEMPPKKKEPMLAAERKASERHESVRSSENPISTIKNFVCKYLC
jgi:hypothetical protein